MANISLHKEARDDFLVIVFLFYSKSIMVSKFTNIINIIKFELIT